MTAHAIRRLVLAATALAALPAVMPAPVAASERHSWCLVVQDWGDGWACGYDTFAQCEAEARAGNTGYCAANPYYRAPAPARPSRRRRQPR
jgi:ABC-type sugar transport system substrate-binding protein